MLVNTLAEIQQDLRELYGPTHYYTTAYSEQELTYCGHVPAWLERYLGQLDSAYVLDIGSGYGTLACLAAKLTGGRVYTLDRLPLLSWAVCNKYKVNRLIDDVERSSIPGPANSWDAVILTEVLEHFNFHPTRTLSRIRLSMRSGGRLFLSTPDASSKWGRCNYYSELAAIPLYDPDTMDMDNPPWIDGHRWQYTEDELRQVIENAGFRVNNWARSLSVGGSHFNVELIA